MFDKNLIKSISFDLPIICVGNISAGGTGKSPMVEYLLNLLKPDYKLATLSRGYKRKTKGFLLVNDATTALETGDEPMQFYQKFPEVAVAVGEKRILAVPQILQERPETQVIILDDSFQHRSIKAGLNILLTDFNHLFNRDYFLPAGNLRDQRTSYKRADILIITKCPSDLSLEKKNKIQKEINPLPQQKIFFTAIEYDNLYHIATKQKKIITPNDEVLLVCGIANPSPLKHYLLQKAKINHVLSFANHHIFSNSDIEQIRTNFRNINNNQKMIITTEKDAVRLMRFKEKLHELPLFVLPVQHKFLFEEGTQFDKMVYTFIQTLAVSIIKHSKQTQNEKRKS